MRLEWLEDILAVAESGSFSEAAAKRHLTQSAFSRRIRQIEQYLGVELFDRGHKPVQLRPTTEGQRDEIARLAATLRKLAEDLRRGDRLAGNRVTVASQHALTTAFAPGLIREVRAHRADVHVRLRSANLDECLAMLLARQAEIALVYRVPAEDPPIEADYIESLTLRTDRLIPVSAPEAALRAEALDIVAYPSEVFLGRVTDRFVLPKLPGTPVPRVETALTLAALELAAAGIGIAWVPATLAAPRIAAGHVADLTGRLPDCELAVTAVRLAGQAGPVEAAVWEVLAGRAG